MKACAKERGSIGYSWLFLCYIPYTNKYGCKYVLTLSATFELNFLITPGPGCATSEEKADKKVCLNTFYTEFLFSFQIQDVQVDYVRKKWLQMLTFDARDEHFIVFMAPYLENPWKYYGEVAKQIIFTSLSAHWGV